MKKMNNVLMNKKQIVAKENGIHSWWTVSLMQWQVTIRSGNMTYRCWRFVSCPNWDGMVPVSWLVSRSLNSGSMKMNNLKQIVAKTNDIHSWWTVCNMQWRARTGSDKMTYRYWRFVSCPNSDGMVPVSWLLWRSLYSGSMKMNNVKQIVAKTNDIHSWWAVCNMQWRARTGSDKMTYRFWRFVSCPNSDGMVPVSWLVWSHLKSRWMIYEKQIVAKENGIHSWWAVSLMQWQVTIRSGNMTYRYWRYVSCPNSDGMVPVSWLSWR
jgi:hypothetical protein